MLWKVKLLNDTNCEATFDAVKCRYAFRFMNGASMRYFDPMNWSAAPQACYTLSSAQAGTDGFGACSAHSGGARRGRVTLPRRRRACALHVNPRVGGRCIGAARASP